MNSVDEVSVEAARLGASEPKGVWTGERYLESLMDGRRVWHEGERVSVVRDPQHVTLPACRTGRASRPCETLSPMRLSPG